MSDECREHLIEQDDGPDLRFTGRRIAAAASSPERQSGIYSGQIGAWDELELYQTIAGTYVCVCENRTAWQGQRNVHRAAVAADASAVIAFFGQGWLAKDVYLAAGIDNIQDVA